MTLEHLNEQEYFRRLKQKLHPQTSSYLAMYSTWVKGFVTEPHLMLVPIDDHQVHRGDAVFEAIKVVNRKPYLLEAHLNRLARSASLIGLNSPLSLSEQIELINELISCVNSRQLEAQDLMLRIFLSRGPGGFTTNPYECKEAVWTIVITQFKPMAEENYQNGVRLSASEVLAKDSFFAGIKSCNYLQNVLMKKEAIDQGFDFMIGFKADGSITESSTENIALIDSSKRLLIPKWENILKGTTLVRLSELLLENKLVDSVVHRDLFQKDLLEANEVWMVGTTLDVLPVKSFDFPVKKASQKWSHFELATKARSLLMSDQK